MRRDVFQAIADPTRRKIIHLIATDSLNLNAVAEQFKISRPAISKHIKILTECGLVKIRQEGRERLCQANLKSLGQVADWVAQYSVFWNTRLDALEQLLLKEMNDAKSITTKKPGEISRGQAPVKKRKRK